ncbi:MULTISPECIES: hypothetical protein [unclassified Bradyrhizobium]|uniref:hypothetical protein n=1 Tax=unclassified Bradyrhizobium TaxID=2631580 RepID=UPI0028E6C3DB|nr:MULTISPECIES: hypothetical protein [unclassified Bradyrhizobium]
MAEPQRQNSDAGLPPWLLLFLTLLVFGLPQSYQTAREDLGDFQKIDEMNRLELAVANVDDASSIVAKSDAQQVMQHHAHLLNWLKNGACIRFRAELDRALAAIEQANFLEDDLRGLYRQQVKLKKDAMALILEMLDDDERSELVQIEGKRPPPTASKAEIIHYLLEPKEDQRQTMSTNWRTLAPQARPTLDTGDQGHISMDDVWRSRISLILSKPAFLVDLGITLIPIFCLLTVAFPRWRAWHVERTFGLREYLGGFPEIDELQAFVATSAPRIELRVNLLHSGYAFVYPRSYRRPRLAVLGGMYVLWKRDPVTARGILLHEMEHVRQGDHLVVGYGSFFSGYLKWLLVIFILVMAMTLISSMALSVRSVGLHIEHQAQLFGRTALMALCSTASLFFLIMASITKPLVAIWALELNADYGGSRAQVLHVECGTKAMGAAGRISRMLGTLSHPPVWLRAWLIRRDDWMRRLLRQILFPASYPIAILMLFLMGFFATLPDHGLRAERVKWLLGLSLDSLERNYWKFGSMAALLLAWPWLSGYWELFFIGAARQYKWWDGGRWAAALLLTILAILAWFGGRSS